MHWAPQKFQASFQAQRSATKSPTKRQKEPLVQTPSLEPLREPKQLAAVGMLSNASVAELKEKRPPGGWCGVPQFLSQKSCPTKKLEPSPPFDGTRLAKVTLAAWREAEARTPRIGAPRASPGHRNNSGKQTRICATVERERGNKNLVKNNGP